VSFEASTPFEPNGRLNPDWVEWLVGLPEGYTDPDATLEASPRLDSNRLRLLDLRSGIGGRALGLQPWCVVVGYCEADVHAQRVLEARQRDRVLDAAPIFDSPDAAVEACRGRVDMLAGTLDDPTVLAMERWIVELGVEAVLLESSVAPTGGGRVEAFQTVLASLRRHGFHSSWVSVQMAHYNVRRWVLLAKRRRVGFEGKASPCWGAESAARQTLDQWKLSKEQRRLRLRMLGEVVGPQMIRTAVACMALAVDTDRANRTVGSAA